MDDYLLFLLHLNRNLCMNDVNIIRPHYSYYRERSPYKFIDVRAIINEIENSYNYIIE